ncbi:MAG: hemolysin III family protein [Actinobacteria bacterium]|nr:hemolysin III family protein [Actinomycetota bacterium]
MDVQPSLKPRLRGVLHQRAFYASLVAGVLLITAASTVRSVVAAAVFAVSVSALLGVSALYHRGDWTQSVRMKLRRLDHSMIFMLIAGTYTPFALLVLDGTFSTVLLVAVWACAVAGSVMELALAEASKWIMAVICIGLGWVSIIAMPQIARDIGAVGTALLAAGGVAYTVGAIIYAAQKPNPVPQVFGYHEVFHALVVVAIALQYSVVAFYVVPG